MICCCFLQIIVWSLCYTDIIYVGINVVKLGLLRSLIETNHRLKALLLGEAIVLLAHAELFERLAAAKGLRDERMVVVEYFKYVLDYFVLLID
jgi:hypothetical protein